MVGEVFFPLSFVRPRGVHGSGVFPEGGAGFLAGEGAACGVVFGPELFLRTPHAGPVAVAVGAEGSRVEGARHPWSA